MQDVLENDALSLEYKRDYGTARRNVDLADLINHANLKGVVCVFGPGFKEELTDLLLVQIGVIPDDGADSPLVLKN